jgi:hypothetical protein
MVIPDDNMKAEGNLFWDDGVGIGIKIILYNIICCFTAKLILL